MDFTVKVEGLENLKKSTAEVQKSIDIELRKALFVSAKKVEGDAKRSILSGNKTGRIYKRGSVSHQASAPGQAPANDTGRLANNINSALNRLVGKEAIVWINKAAVKYATMLEFGTKKMAARPFFFRALESNKQWIKERLQKAVRDGVEKSGKK